ncbi:MAG: ethanolamine utilization protein EutH [Cellulosilyticaceae bacterium]
MFTKILFGIVSLFFVWGGLAYIRGDRNGIGKSFEDGLMAIGPLALNMIGIFVLAPFIAEGISYIGEPISRITGIDMSVLPASVLALDMGGFQIARAVSGDVQMGLFSGIILAAGLGATISFSIPVALGMVAASDRAYLMKGLVAGLMAMPFGALAGGVMQGIAMGILIKNMLPMLVGVVILGGLIQYKPGPMIRCFEWVSKGIVVISIAGLLVVGVLSILGIQSPNWKVDEAAVIVVKIGVFLAGAYPMLYFIQTKFAKPLETIGRRWGMNEVTIAGLIGNLASNLLVFSRLEKMDPKGKVIASAFAMSGAFVCGGQLAFVNTVASEMVMPFIVSKVVGGILAMGIAWVMCYENESQKVTKN